MAARYLFAFLILTCFSSFAQTVVKEQVEAKIEPIDTLQIDSAKMHSPRKAMLYSAILPTSGQWYNHFAMKKLNVKKGRNNVYWKTPLFLSALTFSTFSLINNQKTLKSINTEYRLRDADPNYVPQNWTNYTKPDLVQVYNQHQTRRDFSILAVAGIYLLQVFDANVEGYFVHFDLSTDLSFQAYPKILNQNTVGIGINLNFN